MTHPAKRSLPGIKTWVWAIGVALFLKYLLEPTGWLFYELHHLTGIDSVYWGYTVFRGGGYFFNQWAYQSITCLGVGLLILAIGWWRGARA